MPWQNLISFNQSESRTESKHEVKFELALNSDETHLIPRCGNRQLGLGHLLDVGVEGHGHDVEGVGEQEEECLGPRHYLVGDGEQLLVGQRRNRNYSLNEAPPPIIHFPKWWGRTNPNQLPELQ